MLVKKELDLMTRALALYINRTPYELPSKRTDEISEQHQTRNHATPSLNIPNSKNIEYFYQRGFGQCEKNFENSQARI